MSYRNLTKEETSMLLSQNCFSENWDNITVREGFTTENIRNTCFEGIVKIGVISGTIELERGAVRPCSIINSFIKDCEIGSGVFISEVKNLSNYIIEDNVAISNVGSLTVNGETTFGNGTEIEVLNEGGGRELPIFDRLSSQIAYLTVLYRHDREFTDKITGIIRDYCRSKRSDRGLIETGSRITDSLIIRNVNIGSYTVISGAGLLEEGTIKSCSVAPVYIGTGVVAKKFLILSGSRIDAGVILDKSFVGQGVIMGKQFSAENSVFFANSEAFHGEACSLFAGPFSVTHHKSTLMIASLVSFFNAGSGTNQSNHMYKLGPVHQGILERGSKTGSFSYLLLPCHIGAFSVVMGKHYSNFDTSDFPFSYISEEKGKSELTPAMNLFTVGTRRDIDKWPARDRRKDEEKLDLLHFELFSPYIAGRIINGIAILNELSEKTGAMQDYVYLKGIGIRRLLLKTTRKYYEIALKIYLGRELIKRIGEVDSKPTMQELRGRLVPEKTEGTGKWVDLCGMFSPASEISRLIDSVKGGSINTVFELNDSIVSIYNNYSSYSWAWCSDFIRSQTGKNPENLSAGDLAAIISEWKTNNIKLDNMILKDAEKEFDAGSKTGFGIDGDIYAKNLDFEAVRGSYDKNKFVKSLQEEIKMIEEKAGKLIAFLENIEKGI